MANLDNKRIKDTYEGLIKTNDNNPISGEVVLTDGAGNSTGVSVSTDGRVVASGTVSFGSLKDTGENITITKFVDESDGIAGNDNDTTIPTSAAVKNFVDSNAVTSVNTQTGSVVLNTDNINEGSSNLYYTEGRVSANSSVAANTAKNTYPSADATKVGHITVTQAVDLDTLESNVATNNAKTGITAQQAADITTNNAKVGISTSQANAITANTAKISFDSTSSSKLSGIEANADVTDVTNVTTALNSISVKELSDISTSSPSNNQVLQFKTSSNKFEPTTLTSTAPVDSVNSQTGTVVLDTDDIAEGSSNLYFTDGRVSGNSAVAANTAKTGITTSQANAITANTAKVGITTDQANAITANTAKNSYPSGDATKVGHLTVTQAVDLDTMESDIATNNAKNTYPSGDATKVGHISVTQAVDLDTMESNIATNNAKISFDSTSSSKLAGIEAGADVTDTTNVTAAGALMDSEVDADIKTLSLPANTTISTFAKTILDDADASAVRTTIGAGTSNLALGTSSSTALAGDTTTISGSQASAITANTAKNSYPSADSTKVGFISVTQSVDLDTLESDVATNNAKVGITTTQANNITANNAKISFDSTSSTKLGTIEENADVTDTANVTAAGALMDSEVDADIKTLSLPASTTISTFAKTFLDDADAAAVRTTIGAGTSSTTGTVTSVTVGTALGVTSGTSTPNITLDTTNLYKVIGIATDHSSRVLSDSGTSEGATSIMQNFETLIFN